MQHCPFSPFYFLPPELLQNILQFTSLDDFDYIQRPGYERRLKQQRQRTNRMFQKRIDLSNDEERSIRMAIKTLELSVRQSGKCNNSVQKEPESNVSIFQHEKDKPHSRTQFHAVTSQRLPLFLPLAPPPSFPSHFSFQLVLHKTCSFRFYHRANYTDTEKFIFGRLEQYI